MDSDHSLSRPAREFIVRLERSEPPSGPKGKDLWDRIQILSSLVMPVVLVLIAFEITGKLDNYVKERRFEVESATAMSKAFVDLMRTDSELEAQQYAIQLVGYGQQSVVPLMYVLQDANPVRAEAARRGLEMLSPSAHGEVCARLDLLLANQSGLYTLQTHRNAVHIVRRTGCKGSVASLEKYRKRVTDDLAAFDKTKRQPTAFADKVELSELRWLKEDVDFALKTLSSTPK